MQSTTPVGARATSSAADGLGEQSLNNSHQGTAGPQQRSSAPAGIAKRQTASVYLKALCDVGVLREVKAGREKLFIHPNLITAHGREPQGAGVSRLSGFDRY